MLAMEVIRPVSEAWPGSTLPLFTCADGVANMPLAALNTTTNILIISIVALVIILFRQVASTFLNSAMLVFSENRRDEVLNDSNFGKLSFVTTVLLVPAYAFVVSTSGVSTRSLAVTMLLVASLLLFRLVTFRLMAWAGNDSGMIDLERHSDSAFILLMTLSLPVYIVSLAFPAAYHSIAAFYLAAVAVVSFLAYLPSCLKIIKSSRFSHFFCFLYLCILEILPIAVVVKILVS